MGIRAGDEMIEIEAEIKATTAKAWLVEDQFTMKEAWLAKSIAEMMGPADKEGITTFSVPEWWAKKNSLI
jgi:hypothetical protein